MSEVEKCGVKRRPRILAIQKKLLVQLIENYFIRTTGKRELLNFEAIEPWAFEEFADILNTWGPGKTSREWKSSFYYMKNRIRRSVELIIQNNASVKDNLSDVDFKLYSMSPSWFQGALQTGASGVDLNNDFGLYTEDIVPNLNPDIVKQDSSGFDYGEDFDNYAEGQLDAVEEETGAFDDGCYTEQPTIIDTGNGIVEENTEWKYSSCHVLVAETAEELEDYSQSFVVMSEDKELPEVVAPLIRDDTPSENCNSATLEDCPSEFADTFSGSYPFRAEVQRKQDQRAPKDTETSKNSTKAVKSNNTPKVCSKIPELQKERLIQLVQNNFMKSFGQFVGSNGKFIRAQFWESTANELNTLGPPRTGKQWKATFNSIKSLAKSKLADDHNNVGGYVTKPLTRLEEKVISIYGMDALDGTQDLGEAGFRYKKTVPVARRVCESTVTSGAFENLSSFPENEEILLEASTAPHLEIENSSIDNAIIDEDIREEAETSGFSVTRELNNELSNEPITNDFQPITLEETTRAPRSEAAGEVGGRNQSVSLNLESNSYEIRSENQYNCQRDNISSSSLRGHSSHHSRGPSYSRNCNAIQKNTAASTSIAAVGTSRQHQPEMQDRESSSNGTLSEYDRNRGMGSSSSQFRGNSAHRTRGSSHGHKGNTAVSTSTVAVGTSRQHQPEMQDRELSSNGTLSEYDRNRGMGSSSSQFRGNSAHRTRGSSHGHKGNTAVSTSTVAVGTIRQHQPEMQDRELSSNGTLSEYDRNRRMGSSSSQFRGNSAHRTRGSSHGADFFQRPRGTSNGVRGVPRLHVRRRRRSTEQISEITSINQLFNDEGSEEENSRSESGRGNASSSPRNTNAENTDRTVASVERDRSNLRHRHTSFEIVQHSIDAQERFIEDSNRNHSQLMYVTERNHSEMLGVINASLRTMANVAERFLDRM